MGSGKCAGCVESLSNYKFPVAAYIILFHEFLERFSFYGMKGILTVYLNSFLQLSENTSTVIYHVFVAVSYLLPILGAFISDNYWGRYKTVVIFGMVYMVGHILLPLTAITPNLTGPLIGIFILAIGTGTIKPCVAAFGGDQIPENSPKKMEAFFSIFYASINIGAFISQYTIPNLRKDVSCFGRDCYLLAFGVPAIIFIITYIIFVAAKPFYKIMPTEGNVLNQFFRCIYHAICRKIRERKTVKKESILDYADDKFEPDFINDVKIAISVMVLFTPFPIFWALFDQQGSRWTLQARKMDGYIGGDFNIKPEQMQAVNPLLICFAIPLFDTIIYPLLGKCNLLKSPTSRIVAGYIFAIGSFVMAGFVQLAIDNELPVNIAAGRSELMLSNFANNSINVSSQHWTPPISLGPLESTKNMIEVPAGLFNLTAVQFSGSIEPEIFSSEISASSTKAVSVFLLNNNNFNIQSNYIDRTIQGGFENVRVVLTENLSENTTIVARSILENSDFNKTLFTWQNNEDFIGPYIPFEAGRYRLILIDTLKNETKKIGNFEVKITGSVTLSILRDANNNYVVHSVTELSAKIVSILLQFPQYIIMTCAEILLSVTAMSFAYSVAPASMKALLQSAYLITIFVGNIIVTIVVSIPSIPNQAWEFFIFAILVGVAGIINFILAIRFNREHKKRDNYNQFISDQLAQSAESMGENVL